MSPEEQQFAAARSVWLSEQSSLSPPVRSLGSAFADLLSQEDPVPKPRGYDALSPEDQESQYRINCAAKYRRETFTTPVPDLDGFELTEPEQQALTWMCQKLYRQGFSLQKVAAYLPGWVDTIKAKRDHLP